MWSSGLGWQPRAAETWLQGYGRRQNLRPRTLIYLHSLYSWNLCCIALYCLHCTNECVQENVFNSLKQKSASLRLFVLEGDGRRSCSWERIFLCPFLSRQFQLPDRCCKVAVFRGAPVFTQRCGTAAPSKGRQGEVGSSRVSSGGNRTSQELASTSPGVIVLGSYCHRLLIFTVSFRHLFASSWSALHRCYSFCPLLQNGYGGGKKTPTEQPPNQTVFLLQVLRWDGSCVTHNTGSFVMQEHLQWLSWCPVGRNCYLSWYDLCCMTGYLISALALYHTWQVVFRSSMSS